jgi:hypothetical protein
VTSAAKFIKTGYLLPEVLRLGSTSKAAKGLQFEVQILNHYPATKRSVIERVEA